MGRPADLKTSMHSRAPPPCALRRHNAMRTRGRAEEVRIGRHNEGNEMCR